MSSVVQRLGLKPGLSAGGKSWPHIEPVFILREGDGVAVAHDVRRGVKDKERDFESSRNVLMQRRKVSGF